MFYYGNHGGKPQGEWRPEVHDSDGLLIHDGESGEWLWHPLRNPATLAMDYFQTTDVRGFGLIQRDQSFHSYMDSEAHYQSRPSAWIEPEGQWDKGEVVLVQLPTSDETNDNIVAFWTPREKIPEKQPLDFNYTIHYGDSQVPGNPWPGSWIPSLVMAPGSEVAMWRVRYASSWILPEARSAP